MVSCPERRPGWHQCWWGGSSLPTSLAAETLGNTFRRSSWSLGSWSWPRWYVVRGLFLCQVSGSLRVRTGSLPAALSRNGFQFFWNLEVRFTFSESQISLISCPTSFLTYLFFFYETLFFPDSVQFSRSVVSNSLWPHELQHTRPPCLSPTPGVHPNPCPLSQWCHPIISSSVVPFSSCPRSLPASESFPMSQLLAWGGQSAGVSALASLKTIYLCYLQIDINCERNTVSRKETLSA